MIKIGIVGVGYWGPNLLRNFSAQSNAIVRRVVDTRQEKLQFVQKNYPHILTSLHFDDLLNDPEIDALVIATPVFTHFDLAQKALQKNKHVLLEKAEY